MTAAVRIALAADAASLAAIRAAAAFPEEGQREAPGAPPGCLYFAQLIEQHADRVYVAQADGSALGYVALQPAAHPAVAARRPLNVWQLYVARAFHGTGVAALLMSAAREHAHRHRHDVLWLGVAEHNLRAAAFYRKQGFAALGLHDVGAAGHLHQDLVMSCPVTGS
jgi:ribosomal protein S18 acetylase RimI-like enzyme